MSRIYEYNNDPCNYNGDPDDEWVNWDDPECVAMWKESQRQLEIYYQQGLEDEYEDEYEYEDWHQFMNCQPVKYNYKPSTLDSVLGFILPIIIIGSLIFAFTHQ